MFEIVHYQDETGRTPFQEWMERLKDKRAKARISSRLGQLGMGNMATQNRSAKVSSS